MNQFYRTLTILNLLTWPLLSACDGGVLQKKQHHSEAPAATPPGQLITDKAGKCKLTTRAQWQDFAQRNAADSRWVDTCEDSECNDAYRAFVQNDVQATLEECAGLIEQNPDIKRCTERFRRFTPTWINFHDRGNASYGFTRDNHSYLPAQTGPDKPAGMMDPPQVIIDAMPTREKVEEAARLHGFKYLTHDSAIDNIRTFVYRHEARFDQWLILNLATKDGDKDATLVFSVLGVEHHDASGKKLDRVKLNFRDYDVVTSKEGKVGLQYTEDKTGKCYACHVSGTRKLIDRLTPVTAAKPVLGEPDFDQAGTKPVPADFGRKRLNELNDLLMSYGLPDWGQDVVFADHGPTLGQEQGCTGCHNGANRGMLTVLSSETQIIKKVADQFSMPPRPGQIELREKSEMRPETMSDDDKAKLDALQDKANQLARDYMAARLPALQSWLLQDKCE